MIFLLLLQALSLHTSPLFASEWVDAISGKWQVTEVHINTEASVTSSYSWDDPRLIGRLFNFNPNAFWNDSPESGECIAPRARSVHMEPSKVIASSMAGFGYPAQHASAAAYKIDLKNEDNASIVQIYCGSKRWQEGLGADGGVPGAWVVTLGPDRLLLRWFGETLMVLNRVPEDAKPNPSFSCSISDSKTEQIICQSYELSAFDRSISDAYQQLLTQAKKTGAKVNRLIESQRSWVKTLDTCQLDRNCILGSMKRRLEWLASQNQT